MVGAEGNSPLPIEGMITDAETTGQYKDLQEKRCTDLLTHKQ
jgi:hypothetical protein